MSEATFVVDWALTSVPEGAAGDSAEVSKPPSFARVVHLGSPGALDLERDYGLTPPLAGAAPSDRA
jgi:hypothetical protein